MKNAALFLFIFCASLVAQESKYFEMIKKDGIVLCSTGQDFSPLNKDLGGEVTFWGHPTPVFRMTGAIAYASGCIAPEGAIFFNGQSALTFEHTGTSPVDIQAPLTIEAWVVQNARTADIATILDNGYSWRIGIAPNGCLTSAFLLQNHVAFVWQGSAEIPLDTWSHIVVTYDGKTVRHFMNGLGVYSNDMYIHPLDGQILLSNQNLCMGARSGDNLANRDFFKGGIGRLALYHKALTEDVVWTHYQTGVEVTYRTEQAKIDYVLGLRPNTPFNVDEKAITDAAIKKLADKKAVFELQKKAFEEYKAKKITSIKPGAPDVIPPAVVEDKK